VLLALAGCSASTSSRAVSAQDLRGELGPEVVAKLAGKLGPACHLEAHAGSCLVLAAVSVRADRDRLLLRALAIWRRACDRGDADACSSAAALVAAGHLDNPEAIRLAMDLWERACSGGEASVCESAGERREHGSFGAPVDLARAAVLYARGCDAGDGACCNHLGWVLRSSEPQRAAVAYARGCEAGEAWSCVARGQLHGSGRELPRDLAEAFRWFDRACAMDAGTCYYPGSMLRYGEGVPVDTARAHALFSRACKTGDAKACDEAARLRAPFDGPRSAGPF
jgi:hypothetical protein